jgi:hypothetical protein
VATQAIYYAKNIASAAAGANTVTVTFNVAARFPDIRIAEYSGIDTVNPLDVSVGAQGSTTTSSSGSVATTNANDLLIGANLVQSTSTAAGAGYTNRGITPDGDILEDRVVTATGSYSATAALDKVQQWIMQMVAFRAASGGTPAPSIASLNPTSGPVGTSVTITGANFGSTQGSSSVTFNGTTATPGSWTANSIVVPVPTGAATGNVVVTVNALPSNGVIFTVGAVSAISFVQTNSATPQGTFTSVTVTYAGAQTAGNLNVVVVGWNDSTATVSSVTDSIGNTYALAAAPIVQAGTASQAIYYAKNIGAAGAGANTVNVTFAAPAIHPDIRIAEYSGLDPLNPLDTSVGAQGTTTATSDSGPVATANPNDLLVGANIVQSTTTAAGAGYTSRGITADGDILEDQVVSIIGSYNATAVLDKVQSWIMQMVAFRAAGSGGGTVPNIASLNPTSGPAGTSVTIQGSNFGATQGTSTVKFNATTATPTSWGATSITVPVPAGATSGGVVVTVGSVASNTVNFTVTTPAPSITSLNPTSGLVGTSVTITGANFGASQGTSTVTFNGTAATPTSWSATSIAVPVPTGATTGNVVVTVGGVASNGTGFTVTIPPSITSLNPTSGPVATSVTITGSNFGATQGTSTVTFNGTAATPTSWSATSIAVPVPTGATTGNVVVTVGGVASNGVNFTVSIPPSITGLSPISGPVGTSITISGANFGTSQGTSTVTFGGAALTPASWNGTSIMISVPNGAAAGSSAVVVTVGGLASNSVNFLVTPAITNLNPNSGPLGTSIAVSGSSFGATQGSSTVTFNGITGTPTSWGDTSIAVPVANGATTGNVVVIVGTVASNGVAFTVTSPGPSISTLNPTSGTVGTSVTISGANFGSSQGTSTVTFNGTAATPTSWGATSIAVPVPTGATTGNVVITVGGVASNGVSFTVTIPPSITSLNPTSGQVGTSVTIAGTNFGTTQGTSTVTFSGVPVTPTNWTATSITVPVPTAATGNVVVTAGGVASNGVNFTVLPPSITALNPTSGAVSTSVTITGSGFGSSQGASGVSFNGTGAFPTSWGATSIVVPVPAGATTGNVVVSVAGMASNGLNFTVTPPPPSITSLSPSAGAIGASVTIAGANFGASQGTSTVTFNGVNTTPTSWSASSIIAPVPVGAATGNVVVTVVGIASNGVLFTVQSGIATIQLIQHGGKDAGSTSSATLAFPANNTAGNFIAVAIRAGRSGAIFTVSDSLGNTYRQAIQYNVTVDTPNGDTLGVFYAENIAGGANTVTVADNINGKTLRFAILEYSSVATSNSLDITAVNQSVSTAPSTVSVNTTANGDLLFGAIMTAAGDTVTAGTNYTLRDAVPAAPNTKLITEDGVQATAGAATASATLSGSDKWGAGLAAFKPGAGGGGGTGPGITGLNPTSGVVGISVTISGTNFGGTQGSSAVTFNGTAATPTSWGASSIAVPVPTNATSGNVVVTVGGVASNGVPFTVIVPPPSIGSLNPTSGAIGVSVIIAGSNFGASQGSSTVTFNGIATAPTSWSASSITAPVPNGATTGNVVVTVGGVASNGVTFTVTTPGPSISTLSMTQGPVGAIVTITGVNFGSSQGTSTVTFGSTSAGTATNWSSTSIDVPVPTIALGTVNVVVTVAGVPSNGLPFTVTPPPSITNITPTSGPVGTVVTINGANFGPTVGTRTSLVLFNGLAARTNSWSNTQILVPVPTGATTGNVVVSISGIVSNGITFTVTLPPSITSLSPTSGMAGTSVTITGINFGATRGTSTVTFNGTPATPTSWSDPSIIVPVPNGATTGNVVVTVGGVASNGVNFTVTSSGAPITLIQHTSKDAGLTSSSSLAFTTNNTAGNFIAVVIRAGKPSQVFTVSDSRGNTYRQAIQFNEFADGETIGIFYAENIAAGSNTVTVSDTISGQTLRFAILEYSGIMSANSLDVTAVTSGSGTSPNSGNATTLSSGDLLLGEIATADTPVFTAGSGYKIEEAVPSQPNAKLIVEDMIQASAGTASASASLSVSEIWAAGLAAFRSASGGPPPPIAVSVSPTTASTQTGSGTQVFTATVQFDPLQQGVTFSLSGAGCSGLTCGTLSSVTPTSATYTAPANAPNPATVTLTATSVTDNTKSATATITVVLGPLTVTVSPKRGSITTSQTQQFTGTAFNDPNNAGVTWQVDGNNGGNSTTGTITPAGLFTPGTQAGLHTVTATSVTNASVNTSVSFAVSDIQGVYKYHNDLAGTGQNLNEYSLTPATVNSSTFFRLFSCPVDGYVYAQPLYVANLLVGSTTRNVVFIATEHDSVYAFDADSPSCLQLWKTSFLGTGVTTMSWLDTSPTSPTNDVFPEIGITSTPVIDPATNTIYVEAKTKETVGTGCSNGSPCYVHRLHALNITTGAEKFGGPVVISAPNFVSLRHFNRPALLLSNGTIYIGFGSHGDICNWQGWFFGYDPATLAQKFVFPTSNPTVGCNGASIWDGGAGPAADAGGNLYVTTGNGSYDGTTNFSESVLKFSPAGSLVDWFTPFNRSTLDANDIDLGSAGMIILPDSVGSSAHPHLALATGKIAILYLLDQTNMGKFNSGSNKDVQEVIPVPPPNTTQLDGGNYGVPAYWNGNIYTTGQNFPLSQFTISNGTIATPQFAVSSNMFPARGATPAVSASGTTNGIVWVLDLSGWGSNGNAILDAYDASNVSNLLFSSPVSGSGASGAAVKFTVPTVANGKVYVGGQTSFTVFGLLP